MEQQVKHRLTGATVLVALGVIFIPMILSQPEKTSEIVIDMASPPESGNAFRSRIVPLDEESAPSEFEWPEIREQADIAPEAPIVSMPAREPEPILAKPTARITRRQEPEASASFPPKPAAKKTRELPTASVETVTNSAGSLKKPWAVQVGSFTEERNALGLRDRLRAKGYRSFVESVEEGGAITTTRVFVGPTLRRDDALRANKKLRGELDIKGLVIRYAKEK
uniref:DedD protein n=1 Tax=Candidatus Kentrum sp. DK TaxID=2126562 RepID=A0A450RW79_9GAMM|nr:MAG: DedD protein [Candidatus Kentron sp. DK]